LGWFSVGAIPCLRMIRRDLFSIASAASLLLSVLIGVSWITSRRVPVGMYVARPGGNLYLIGANRGIISAGAIGPWPEGEFRVTTSTSPVFTIKERTDHHYGRLLVAISGTGWVSVGADGHVPWRNWLAPNPPPGPAAPTSRVWGAMMPAWALLILASLLPLAWLIVRAAQAIRSRLPKPGECVHCRYDLTANASGVCPECGTPVPSKPEVVA